MRLLVDIRRCLYVDDVAVDVAVDVVVDVGVDAGGTLGSSGVTDDRHSIWSFRFLGSIKTDGQMIVVSRQVLLRVASQSIYVSLPAPLPTSRMKRGLLLPIKARTTMTRHALTT